MPVEYAGLAEVEAAFDRVMGAIAALLSYAERAQPQVWSLDGDSSVEWLGNALNDVWYVDGQDGRATRSFVGMVAADEWLLDHAQKVNDAKTALSYCLAEVKSKKVASPAEIKAALSLRHPLVKGHLEGAGLARLNLKQCWRQIPISPLPLSRIHLSWYSSGRSITRMTAAEAVERLEKMDTDADHIQIQLRALASIPPSEVLARVQHQAPLIRGNLFFREPLASGKSRKAMNLSLPLFVPAPEGVLPTHKDPEQSPPAARSRKVRSDEKLEPEPFLPSLRAYRYRA